MKLRGFLRSFAGIAMSLACLVSIARPQQQAPSAELTQQVVAKQAVEFVLSRYQIDPSNLVSKKGKPLSVDGQWSVKKEPPETCPKTTDPCVRVLYHVPDPDIACEWTVLLGGSDQKNTVLNLNENAARFLMGKPHSPGPVRRSGENPPYPLDARRTGVQGDVKLMVHIDVAGHVDEVTVISGPGQLRNISVAAVKKWTYEPLVIGSSAIPRRTLVIVNFAIGSGPHN
jgi:outer membrane biosynthesis protein TonB